MMYQQKSFNSYRLLFSALFSSASKFVTEPEIVFIALVSEERAFREIFVTRFRRIQQNLASDSYQSACFSFVFYQSQKHSDIPIPGYHLEREPARCPNQPFSVKCRHFRFTNIVL
uniref:(northern house mosquito) hypothetical protein n=1 Tax=Culex pipiens TaxID=7175 RepID=A0A8D8D618_CULPI